MNANTPQVEPGIAPLVKAINTWPELETFASCAGHPWRGDPPYVAFRTASPYPSPETLRLLNDLTQRVEHAARFRLWHPWAIRGWFHPDPNYGLVFAVEAQRLATWLWWSRSKIRRDVEILAVLLSPPSSTFPAE